MPGRAGGFGVICDAAHLCDSSLGQKLAPVAEVNQPGFSVAAVANWHEASRRLLFDWRWRWGTISW